MNEQQVRSLHQRSSHVVKEKVVRRARGPADIGMRAMIRFTDGCTFGGAPGPETDSGDTAQTWGLLIVSAKVCWLQHGKVPMDFFLVTSEGYVRTSDAPPTNMQRGDMQREYETNPDTDVSEMLMTNTFQRDEAWLVVEPYTYGDHGELQWGPLSVNELQENDQGLTLDLIRGLWEEIGT